MADRLDTVFLDRDGTINVKAAATDYVTNWQEFEFLPGAIDGLCLLTEAGMRTIVVTNQRGVALGRMTPGDVNEIHRRMQTELAAHGARIDAVYHCPHAERACDCRKPRTGMFVRASRDFPEIDLRRSAVIGDSWRDVEAAAAVGALSVLIDPDRIDGTSAHHVVPSLYAAAALVTRISAGDA